MEDLSPDAPVVAPRGLPPGYRPKHEGAADFGKFGGGTDLAGKAISGLAKKAMPQARPDEDLSPDAPVVAPESPGILRQMAQPFIDIGKGAMNANRAATQLLTHPIDTVKNIGPVSRQAMRGVNSNIPFANDVVEAVGGPAAESPEDAASAPGFQELGSVAGMPLGSKGIGLAAKGAVGAGKFLAKSPGVVKAIGKGALGGFVKHSPIANAIKGGYEAIKDVQAAAKPAVKAAEIATDTATAIPVSKPPKLSPLVAGTPSGKMYETLSKALDGATAEQAVTIKSAMAGLEAKAAKQVRPEFKVPKYSSFDEVGAGPEITPAERSAFQDELKTAHGGNIPGLTDAPTGGEVSATSEQATVAPKRATASTDELAPKGAIVGMHPEQPGWSKNGPSGKLEAIIGADAPWAPSARDAKHAKGLGLSTENYRKMMAKLESRKLSKSLAPQ